MNGMKLSASRFFLGVIKECYPRLLSGQGTADGRINPGFGAGERRDLVADVGTIIFCLNR